MKHKPCNEFSVDWVFGRLGFRSIGLSVDWVSVDWAVTVFYIDVVRMLGDEGVRLLA